MREVLNSISEKIRPLLGMAVLTLAILCAFITLVVYVPISISNDKIFKVLAVCEIALILVVSLSMYRHFKKDFNSEKMAAEHAKNNHEASFIMDNLASGIIYINNSGKIETINKAMCDKIGLEQSSMVGKYITNIENENKDLDYNIEVLQNAIRLFKQKSDENSAELSYSQNGTVNNCLMISKIVYDGSNNVSGLFIEALDMFDKEINLDRLMQVEKLAVAGQMMAGLAHEIKNSICSMKGLAQMMKKKHIGELDKYYDVMLEELGHANELVRNLLSLTKTRTVYENIELSKVIDDITPLIESSASYSGISVNFDVQSNLPKVFGNKEYIKQVIVNIVQNSIEELKKRGNIGIKLWKDEKDENVKLEFKDDGPGIKPECIDRIFEPFFTTKDGGSGLGLAISYEIVKKHGGRMSAFNNQDGGATFLIELPISSSEGKIYKVS